jgi:glycosyltransferase involved in cell wall biosynthesis
MAAPLRVLRIVTRLNVGGPARQIIGVHRRLVRAGVQHRILAGSVSPGEEDLAERSGFAEVQRVPTLARELRPLKDLEALSSVRATIRTFRPHIVHTHMSKAGALGRTAARSEGVPAVVHTFHGHVLEGYFSPRREFVYRNAERWLARWTNSLVAVSENTRGALLQAGIGGPAQWSVIPPGLELEHLSPARPSGAAARQVFGIDKRGPIVGTIGRLTPIKYQATFVRAAARLMQAFPNAEFAIVGDGESRADLEHLAARLCPRPLHFTGWVHDISDLYAALDVVVLTSRNEGTPIALIEAGAAGKPVVATAVGGVPEVVVHNETGLLVKAGDVAQVAGSIDRLLTTPDFASRLGAKANRRMHARYSADRLALDLLELYDRLLRAKRVVVD